MLTTHTQRLVSDECGGQSQEPFGLSGTEEVPLRPNLPTVTRQNLERGALGLELVPGLKG